MGRDDEAVATLADLLNELEKTWAVTGRGLSAWPDPHPDRNPNDDEYSRMTDAAKWRIVGARVEAWLMALGETNLPQVERNTSVQWTTTPRTRVSRTDRAVPHRRRAVPLVVARSMIGDVLDAGVTLGVGDPAVCVAWLPDCGCDACDSGSQTELDLLDQIITGVVSGTFRHLASGQRQITQFDDDGWSASGHFGRREVDTVLANPRGWHEDIRSELDERLRRQPVEPPQPGPRSAVRWPPLEDMLLHLPACSRDRWRAP